MQSTQRCYLFIFAVVWEKSCYHLLLSRRAPWVVFVSRRPELWWGSCLSLMCGIALFHTRSSLLSPSAGQACWVTSFPGPAGRWRFSEGSPSYRQTIATIGQVRGSDWHLWGQKEKYRRFREAEICKRGLHEEKALRRWYGILFV